MTVDCRMLVSLTILTALLVSTTTAYNCVRLRHAPGSCYVFKSTPKTWREAVVDCVTRHGGHLVTMETEGEAKAIRTHLKTNDREGRAHYTGAISIDGHQSWFWYHSGALVQLPTSQWGDGQPDNEAGRGENCLVLDLRAETGGKLADVACWSRNPYVCEVPTPDYADYYGGFRLDERSVDNIPWG